MELGQEQYRQIGSWKYNQSLTFRVGIYTNLIISYQVEPENITDQVEGKNDLSR